MDYVEYLKTDPEDRSLAGWSAFVTEYAEWSRQLDDEGYDKDVERDEEARRSQ